VLAPQKISQQRLGLARAGAALDVDRLEDGDDVFEEELGIVGAPVVGIAR
jgi:hypothetical protein